MTKATFLWVGLLVTSISASAQDSSRDISGYNFIGTYRSEASCNSDDTVGGSGPIYALSNPGKSTRVLLRVSVSEGCDLMIRHLQPGGDVPQGGGRLLRVKENSAAVLAHLVSDGSGLAYSTVGTQNSDAVVRFSWSLWIRGLP